MIEELIGTFTEAQIEAAAEEARELLVEQIQDCICDAPTFAVVERDGRVFIHATLETEEYFELTADGLEVTDDAPAVGWERR